MWMGLKGACTVWNKKVLLRERKRHTACRVVSTPSVVLTGYPPNPDLARGTLPCWGVSYLGTPPSWPGEYPAGGYPTWIPPILTWQGGTLPGGTLPRGTLLGTPHSDLAGYPPSVCPMVFWVMLQSIMGYGYTLQCLPHGILGNVAKHYGISVHPPVSAPWHSG